MRQAQKQLLKEHSGSLESSWQQDSLLTTKLYIPPTTPRLLSRPHLIQQLNEGLQGKLTLLCAPAGFGKTSLLSSWCASLLMDMHAVAWISLEKLDNEPNRFWHYVLVALEQACPGSSAEALALLKTEQSPSIEVILSTVINVLLTSPHRVVLILDDYHTLTAATTIHKELSFLLERLPPQLHLTLASRSDPPLALSRLRSQGQLTEIRTNDLRFTQQETITVLEKVEGLLLTAEDARVLEERTEGWVAGLHLAALSLKGRSDSSASIKSFAGGHRYILDYLTDEVLRQQPEVIQSFLLHTSILEQLSGPLCDAVTGQHHSQTLLEQIEQANLFIVPLDDERTWYRYHHLLSDVLRRQLQHSQHDQIAELHRRAANWYEHNGFLNEAVGHALAAADYDLAAQLMEQASTSLLLQSERNKLQQEIQALPAEYLRRYPRLCIAYAKALLVDGVQLETAESYLHLAEASLQVVPSGVTSAEVQEMLADIDGIHAEFICLQGDITLCREALEPIRREHTFLSGTSSLNLDTAYITGSEVGATHHAFTSESSMRPPSRAFSTCSSSPMLVETLSEREVEVLHLMATGYTNSQIAHALFVSIGTVKTHLKHIFGKLDVHTRTQAATRARQFQLLPF